MEQPSGQVAAPAPRTPAGRPATLLKLFVSCLSISAFTFGGGFVIVSLMKKRFVDTYHWLTDEEMMDVTVLAQSSPGAIAVNATILVGWRVAGFLGMVPAVTATILPPIAILCVVSLFYAAIAGNAYVRLFLRGMQAGVAAILLDVTVSLARNVFRQRSWLHDAMMVLAFLCCFLLSINVIYIILAGLVMGIIFSLLKARKGGDGR